MAKKRIITDLSSDLYDLKTHGRTLQLTKHKAFQSPDDADNLSARDTAALWATEA